MMLQPMRKYASKSIRALAKKTSDLKVEYKPKVIFKVKGKDLEYYLYKDISPMLLQERKKSNRPCCCTAAKKFTNGFNLDADSKIKLDKNNA